MQRDILRERIAHALNPDMLRERIAHASSMCMEEVEEEGVSRGFFFFSRGGRTCVPLSLISAEASAAWV